MTLLRDALDQVRIFLGHNPQHKKRRFGTVVRQ
jgi:hypothetical protein